MCMLLRIEEQKIENNSNLTDGENQKKQRTRKIVKKELPIEENLTQDLSNDIKEEKIDYVLHLLNEADPVRKDIKERKLIILKAHSDKVCLTHGAAVQKIRQFPISAERQLSAAASCVKHSSSRMRLYAS